MIKNMRDHKWQINVPDEHWFVIAKLLETIDPYLQWSSCDRPSKKEPGYVNAWVYCGYVKGLAKHINTLVYGLNKLDGHIEYTIADLESIVARNNNILRRNDDLLTAKILPLDGKYYGTEIDIGVGTNANDSVIIKIWKSGATLSKREIEEHGIDPNDIAEVCDAMSDGHYESEFTFELATRIVDMVNNLPDDESIKFVKMLRG